MNKIENLEFVDSFEKSDKLWEFDICQVMYNSETGKYYVGHDSGCSCPCPFENFTSLADWGKPLTAQEAIAEVRKTDCVVSQTDDKRHCVDAISKHAEDHGH